jgi:oxidase EvaA
MLIEVGDNFNETLPENYMWMTLEQLNTFLKFNNYLNIQSRSLLSTIDFI